MVHIKESKGFGTIIKPSVSRKQGRLPMGKSVSKLPNELSEMAFAIKNSKKLLDLPYDWDSEGALAVPQFVWERATKILTINCKLFQIFRAIYMMPQAKN